MVDHINNGEEGYAVREKLNIVIDRANALTGIESKVDANNRVGQLNAEAIAKETQDRIAADAALQAQIDAGGSGGGGASSWDELTGKPNEFPPEAHTQGWDTITGKPAEYPPESHGHSQSEINGLENRLNQIEDSITEGGSFVDAPDDGKLYGRQSENWAEIVLTGGDSTVYTLPILLRSGDEIQLPLADDGEHLTVMLRGGEIDLPLEAA